MFITTVIAFSISYKNGDCTKPLTVMPCHVNATNLLRPFQRVVKVRGSIEYTLTINQPDLVDRSGSVRLVWTPNTRIGYYYLDQKSLVTRTNLDDHCQCAVDFWYDIMPNVRISRKEANDCVNNSCSWIPNNLKWAETLTVTNINSITTTLMVNKTNTKRYLGFEGSHLFGDKVLDVAHLFAGITPEDNQLFIDTYKDLLFMATKTSPCFQYSETCPNILDILRYAAVNLTVLMSVLPFLTRLVFRNEVKQTAKKHTNITEYGSNGSTTVELLGSSDE